MAGIDLDTAQFQLAGNLATKTDLAWETFPFPDQTFDLVTCIEVIEHIENTGFFLQQIKRVLKPDGHLLLTTPNTQSLIARLRLLLTGNLKSFDAKGDATHLTPIFMHPFQKILQRHTLIIENRFFYPENEISVTSRGLTRIMGKCLRKVLPDPYPGDTICLLLKSGTTHN